MEAPLWLFVVIVVGMFVAGRVFGWLTNRISDRMSGLDAKTVRRIEAERAGIKSQPGGRIIAGLGPRTPPLRGERTATLVELDDGERVHIQLYQGRDGPRAKVTRMKWGGVVPAETLFDDEDVLFYFSELGPDDLTPDGRSTELLRRLTGVVLNCRSIAEVRATLQDLDAAGLYDNQRWATE